MSKQIIIIFEGADDTGKSNIAKALSSEIGIPYWKNNREHEYFQIGEFYELCKYNVPVLFDFILSTEISVILDRSFISEEIYSKAFNRKFPSAEIEATKRELINSDAVVLVVYCEKTHTKESFSDELVVFEKNLEIRKLYEEYISTCPFTVLRLDTTDENLTTQIFQIVLALGDMGC